MRMLLAQRLLGALPVLFGVSIVIFALIHLAPGDVTTALLGPQATERDRAELRHTLGLDQPLPVQYAKWLARTAAGDFGASIATQRPVLGLVLPRFANTIVLAASSLLLAMVIGYGVGFVAALRAGSLFDRCVMSLTLLGGSAPPFWLGLLLVLYFALSLRWLPVSGMQNMAGDGGLLDMLRHLVLPTVTTALAPAAIITRMARSSIIDVRWADACASGARKRPPSRRALASPRDPQRPASHPDDHRPAARLSARRRPADGGCLRVARPWIAPIHIRSLRVTFRSFRRRPC